MTTKEDVQHSMKEAMKAKQVKPLECLPMAKGALLLKEKESSEGLTHQVDGKTLNEVCRKVLG